MKQQQNQQSITDLLAAINNRRSITDLLAATATATAPTAARRFSGPSNAPCCPACMGTGKRQQPGGDTNEQTWCDECSATGLVEFCRADVYQRFGDNA